MSGKLGAPTICVSVGADSIEEYQETLEQEVFVEIRIDLIDTKRYSADEVASLFTGAEKTIATFRPGTVSDSSRLEYLQAAIDAGATYIDIEVDGDPRWIKEMVLYARARSCSPIVSYHNYELTPELPELLSIVESCFEFGADIAKVSCQTNSIQDNTRLLSLLCLKREIVVLGMGKTSKVSRILAPILGSPFTYAARKHGQETAPGQLTKVEVQSAFDQLNRIFGD